MPVVIINRPPPYDPHPVPWERIDELTALQKKRELRVSDFRSVNEFERFYYPDQWERLFYEWGDPKEIGEYVAEKAIRGALPLLKKAVKQAFGKVKEGQSV